MRIRIIKRGKGTDGNGRLRVAIYARFSTTNQRPETIDRQIEAAKAYAAACGMEVVAIYSDEARTATTTAGRERYKDMLAEAMSPSHPFDVILVLDRSRWTRGIEGKIDEHNLKKCGVKVISVTEPFTADDTPESELTTDILDAVNAFMPKITGRKVSLQLRKNCLDGFWTGGPIPDGYRAVRIKTDLNNLDGTPILKTRLDRHEAPGPYDLCNLPRYRMVISIFELWLERYGLIRIAEVLYQEGWRAKSGPERIGTSTIRAILHDPNYMGFLHWGLRDGHGRRKDESEVIKSLKQSHPALVTPEQFAAAQARFRKNKPNQRRAKRPRLSAERTECGVCGNAFTIDCRKDTSSDPRLFCDRKHRFGKDACTNPGISQPRLDRHLRIHVYRRILNSDTITRFIQLRNAEVKRMGREDDPESRQLQESLGNVEQELKNLKAAVARGDVDARHLGEEIEERATLRERLLADLASRKPQAGLGLLILDARTIKDHAMSLRRLILRAPLEVQMQVFQAHIKKAIVHPPTEDGWRTVEIVYDPSALLTKTPEAYADRELTRIKHRSANGN